MKTLRPLQTIEKLENAEALDPIANRARDLVQAVIKPGALRDILHGVPIGHPLHPLMILVPMGTWLSAAVLDAIPGSQKASAILIGTGVVSAAPTALSGWTDWSEGHEQQLRVGIVHAAANGIAVGLYSLSLLQRLRGKSGKALSYAGLGVVSAGGFLGGHMSYRQALGANHVEDVPHRVEPGWHGIGALADLPEGKLEKKLLGEVPLVVLRRGSEVSVLANACSHLSGPLNEGELKDDGGDPCVVCPWHDSAFSLRTGEVTQGPATSPQPVFETRVVGGTVEVLLPHAG
ncbi:(2Fe-2S)-binding protein [Arthrobacter sp. RIT-PI-e]|uniref:Rieske 2Fe-2S domain-containing protein n=1 Tax=Arthrobacter sp. RIT-PI-e TaxID=1681197 RepID=UPI0006769243|nr:Rieske 2Fe-2S domain-containing protein [Arthrobacter sp. RIT-PI-e]KNC20187.1 (2Fe-2S)-binding protein [Arthrobacter sp. RIT-PI-e]